MTNAMRLGAAMLVATLAIGCSKEATPTGEAPAGDTPAATSDNPLLQALVPTSEEGWFEGRVAERLEAGPYLYLAVTDPSGASRWVTTLKTTSANAGDEVTVRSFGVREGFRSKRLDRTFDRLHFAIVRKNG